MRSIPALTDLEARAELQRLCELRGVDITLVESLIEMLGDYSGRGRADGLNDAFWDLLSKHVDQLQADGD